MRIKHYSVRHLTNMSQISYNVGTRELKMTTVELIRNYLSEKLPVGTPFKAELFSALAPSESVRKALTRMANSGELTRIARGVFVCPEKSKYGPVPPSLAKVIQAKTNGEQVQVHGAEAALQFGLSTQVPMRPIYLTTGPSRRFKFGGLTIGLKHVSPHKIAAGKAGVALSALWYLGPKHLTLKALNRIKSGLSESEYKELKKLYMPAWMSDAIVSYERKAA
jgi:hypothetical protein